MIDKGNGIRIPKLDFSSIFIQREAVASQNEESEAEGSEDEGDEECEEEDSNIDSKTKKDMFEKQKAAFKLQMLQGGGKK